MSKVNYIIKRRVVREFDDDIKEYSVTDLISAYDQAFAEVKNFLHEQKKEIDTAAGKIAHNADQLITKAEYKIFEYNALIRTHLGRVAILRYGNDDSHIKAGNRGLLAGIYIEGGSWTFRNGLCLPGYFRAPLASRDEFNQQEILETLKMVHFLLTDKSELSTQTWQSIKNLYNKYLESFLKR